MKFLGSLVIETFITEVEDKVDIGDLFLQVINERVVVIVISKFIILQST